MRDTTEDLNDMLVEKPRKQNGDPKKLNIISTRPIDEDTRDAIINCLKTYESQGMKPRIARRKTAKLFKVKLKWE